MSAITPPTQKKKNEPMRYMYPIVLWSVDVIQSTMILPLLRGTGSVKSRLIHRGGHFSAPSFGYQLRSYSGPSCPVLP